MPSRRHLRDLFQSIITRTCSIAAHSVVAAVANNTKAPTNRQEVLAEPFLALPPFSCCTGAARLDVVATAAGSELLLWLCTVTTPCCPLGAAIDKLAYAADGS